MYINYAYVEANDFYLQEAVSHFPSSNFHRRRRDVGRNEYGHGEL
jgi:hypothetical protein